MITCGYPKKGCRLDPLARLVIILSLGVFILHVIERELIDEYRKSLQLVRRAHKRAKRRRDNDQDDRAAIDCEHLTSMERDLLWTIQYLESGYPPDYHRAIYKWTVPVDPQMLKRIVKARVPGTDESRWVPLDPTLEKLLSLLSPREREAFVMVRGRGISYRLTAEYMGLRSAGTVSGLVKRAERRLRRALIRYDVAHPSQ